MDPSSASPNALLPARALGVIDLAAREAAGAHALGTAGQHVTEVNVTVTDLHLPDADDQKNALTFAWRTRAELPPTKHRTKERST